MNGNRIIIIDESDSAEGFYLQPGSGPTNGQEKPGGEFIRFPADLVIDKAAYTVFVLGRKISFPKKEFELLLMLASNPRKVFKRKDILDALWGIDHGHKDSRSLDVHIRMIRRKLNDLYVTTIRGVGYKLEK